MKWFDKWFYKKAKQVWENNPYGEEDAPMPSNYGRKKGLVANTVGGRSLDANGINFTLYSANGGNVVELRHYDPSTDRHNNTLYVISAEEDLGQSLAHIITVEALKR